jgi:CrcB protein
MIKILVIGLGGFVGAIARYGLSGLVQKTTTTIFPYGTLAVNVLGCFIIGILMYFSEDRTLFSPTIRLLVMVGMLGAFTTFSTFGYETIRLVGNRELWPAVLNVAANVILGIGAVWFARTMLRALSL